MSLSTVPHAKIINYEEEEEIFEKPLENVEYVTLISSDGYEFVITKMMAKRCTMLKALFQDGSAFKENIDNRVDLEFSGKVLDIVIEFLHKKATSRVTEFPMPDENLLDILVAADYLGI